MFVPEDLPFGKVTLASEFSKFKPLAEMFFERGFSPNIKDRYGATLLHYAAWWADNQAVKDLLRHGASNSERDSEGRTAYDLAQYHGHFETASLLPQDNMVSENDALRSYKETTKYGRIAIHHAQTNDMDVCFDLLGYSNDPSEIITLLLESPVFGMTSRRPEAVRVKEAVGKLMTDVANKVSEMDERFRCTVRQSGSAAEGTKTCEPSEFDYVFCLDFFAAECDIVQPDELLSSGFGFLKVNNCSKGHPLSPFMGSRGFIGSAEVRRTFEDYVVAALNSPENWIHENVYFDGLCKFPSDKPVLQVQIQWFGSIYKQMYIDIDIVTGIFKESWYPREIEESGRLSKYSDFFILFHGPSDSDDLVRISSAPSEIGFLKDSPEFVRECYSLAKILKSQIFCPLVQFDDPNSSDNSTECSDGESESENDYDDDDECDKNDDIIENWSDEEESGYTIYLDSSNFDSYKSIKEAYKDDRNPKLVQSVYGWLVHVDESRRVRKIYTPKIGSEDEIPTKKKSADCTTMATSSRNGLKNETKETHGCDICTHYAKHSKDTSESLNYGKINGSSSGQRKISEAKLEDPGLITESNITDGMKITASEDHDHSKASDDKSSSLTTPHPIMQEQKLMEENNLNDNISWKGGDLVEAQDEITSYMLKNCIMHVLQRKSKDEIDLMSHKSVVIDVYKYLHECAERRCLSAVCMSFINILSHVDEHIKKLNGKELVDVVEQRCFRIQCFCKVILGILQHGKTKGKDQQATAS
ncbi:hypothetical protein FSP39_006408 [Pinctada imbricata]|uniref:Mab-21-like nucleotidyltransferase domain-containing protein n=1 Tax=Pinctada imbricata TaxID=66713 RepID=A0AA88XWN7_PINIB|nr:hypothetical protein FSP39_006408 [Pinctada imbricata]